MHSQVHERLPANARQNSCSASGPKSSGAGQQLQAHLVIACPHIGTNGRCNVRDDRALGAPGVGRQLALFRVVAIDPCEQCVDQTLCLAVLPHALVVDKPDKRCRCLHHHLICLSIGASMPHLWLRAVDARFTNTGGNVNSRIAVNCGGLGHITLCQDSPSMLLCTQAPYAYNNHHTISCRHIFKDTGSL